MTKPVKIIIIAVISLFVIYLIYSVYITSKEGTGSFNDFDINSTANKNIKVEVTLEKGFTPNQGGGVMFYAKDKQGIEKKIILDKELTQEIRDSKFLNLLGHLHADHFHASDAYTD